MTEARITPTVLLCGFRDPVRRKRICDWLTRAGVRPKELAPTELHQPIGGLLGLPGFSALPGPWLGPAPEEEMLVMFALPGGVLDRFLPGGRSGSGGPEGHGDSHQRQLERPAAL